MGVAKDKIEPISPQEMREQHTETIPDEVFMVINNLLVERGGREIMLGEEEIIKAATSLMQDAGKFVDISDFYGYHWLDIEEAYNDIGWRVGYHAPEGIRENFVPYYLFSARN